MNVQQFDFAINLMQALPWQRADAETLRSLLQQKQDWYGEFHQQFWEDFTVNIFDLTTANDFGCAVWSVILNQPLTAQIQAPSISKPTFGFGIHYANFNRGNFTPLVTTTVGLTLEQKRIVLRLKMFQCITRCAVLEINAFLADIFKNEGKVYVIDNLNMTMTYVFTFQPSSALEFILKNFDLLPRSAGVKVNYVVTTAPTFGFGPNGRNFTRGNFFTG